MKQLSDWLAAVLHTVCEAPVRHASSPCPSPGPATSTAKGEHSDSQDDSASEDAVEWGAGGAAAAADPDSASTPPEPEPIRAGQSVMPEQDLDLEPESELNAKHHADSVANYTQCVQALRSELRQCGPWFECDS